MDGGQLHIGKHSECNVVLASILYCSRSPCVNVPIYSTRTRFRTTELEHKYSTLGSILEYCTPVRHSLLLEFSVLGAYVVENVS